MIIQDLQRFIDAQESTYKRALIEIKNGHKESHWMWYIFPQLKGLGQSTTAVYYAIKDLDEAKAYLNHPILEKRLVEISSELLKLNSSDANEIFGSPDHLKLKSSMTLFSEVEGANSVFRLVLEKFFSGEKDQRTLYLLYS